MPEGLKDPPIKFTILTGNPVHGFEAYGLWDSQTDALEWANNDPHLPNEWWVFPIYSRE